MGGSTREADVRPARASISHGMTKRAPGCDLLVLLVVCLHLVIKHKRVVPYTLLEHSFGHRAAHMCGALLFALAATFPFAPVDTACPRTPDVHTAHFCAHPFIYIHFRAHAPLPRVRATYERCASAPAPGDSCCIDRYLHGGDGARTLNCNRSRLHLLNPPLQAWADGVRPSTYVRMRSQPAGTQVCAAYQLFQMQLNPRRMLPLPCAYAAIAVGPSHISMHTATSRI